MNASEVRDLSDDELSSRLLELKREQFNLRFQRVSGQLEKTDRVREVRRDIARIKTIQAERRATAENKETADA
jgi:large subunit ribosomal protein L29